MDVEFALSRGSPEAENAADVLRAELAAQGPGLMRFWDCLTPCDGLAGPEGACTVAAVDWDATAGRGRAVLVFPWRANHGCRDLVVTGSDRLDVVLALEVPSGRLRISAAERPPAPTPRDEL